MKDLSENWPLDWLSCLLYLQINDRIRYTLALVLIREKFLPKINFIISEGAPANIDYDELSSLGFHYYIQLRIKEGI